MEIGRRWGPVDFPRLLRLLTFLDKTLRHSDGRSIYPQGWRQTISRGEADPVWEKGYGQRWLEGRLVLVPLGPPLLRLAMCRHGPMVPFHILRETGNLNVVQHFLVIEKLHGKQNTLCWWVLLSDAVPLPNTSSSLCVSPILSFSLTDFFSNVNPLLNLLQHCFCFKLCFFGPQAWEVLAPWPRIKPAPPCTGRQSPNYWTTKEILLALNF